MLPSSNQNQSITTSHQEQLIHHSANDQKEKCIKMLELQHERDQDLIKNQQELITSQQHDHNIQITQLQQHYEKEVSTLQEQVAFLQQQIISGQHHQEHPTHTTSSNESRCEQQSNKQQQFDRIFPQTNTMHTTPRPSHQLKGWTYHTASLHNDGEEKSEHPLTPDVLCENTDLMH